MTLHVGIVGCGLIGKRRATVAREAGDRVVIVADIDAERAQQVATDNACAWATDWHDVTSHGDVDVVVVSTINSVLAPVTIQAAGAGKHVLCEKPLGRNVAEARLMVEAAKRAGVILKTGFNHRHHPAIWRAHELAAQGAFGPLMFIRAVYGHGGRPGYDREWRAQAALSGGGELLDQGVHVVDLCRWFMGDFVEVFGSTATCFWDLGYWDTQHEAGQMARRRQLEDNAFAVLRTADTRTAQFHTSWTQWKNRFGFEVFGRDGYARVDGLGGSYGTETLTVGHRRPESGPPVEEQYTFAGPDLSWQAEWEELCSAISEGRQPLANGEDGLQAMLLLDMIYESARSGRVVHRPEGSSVSQPPVSP